MRIGLDFHGVIDKNPSLFVALAKKVRATGGEIFIITGGRRAEVVDQLKSYNDGKIWWDQFFSITEYLIELGESHKIDKDGDYHFDEIKWDSTKAEYAEVHMLDLHIDDTKQYLMYFKRPFLWYNEKISGKVLAALMGVSYEK